LRHGNRHSSRHHDAADGWGDDRVTEEFDATVTLEIIENTMLFRAEGSAVTIVTQNYPLSRRPIQMRGHGPKLARILEALKAAGELPPGLRPCELHRRIGAMGRKLGYTEHDMPKRSATDRCLSRMYYMVSKSDKKDSVRSETLR
jgi:hypothetical protein